MPKKATTEKRPEPQRSVIVPEAIGYGEISSTERRRYFQALEHEQKELMASIQNSRGKRMLKLQKLLGESVQDTARLRCGGNVWEALAVLEAKSQSAYQELFARMNQIEEWNGRIRKGLGEGAMMLIRALDSRNCPRCGEPGEDCDDDSGDDEAGLPLCDDCEHDEARQCGDECCDECEVQDCACRGCGAEE